MKTYGGLFERIVSFENLLLAARKAQRGKRFKRAPAAFNFHLERELVTLRSALLDRTYRPGRPRRFVVYESKKRLISAAPYRDRVVHHAICNVIEPLWERRFIADTYANRKGRGSHKALLRFQRFCRDAGYVLKCDIVRYFERINRDILFGIIARTVRDRDALDLIARIIELPGAEARDGFLFPDVYGIPIGNLTSQFFANVYLDPFDHHVKETLGCRRYIRYVDDFVVLDDSKRRLREIRAAMVAYLKGIGLAVHPGKTQIFPAEQGTDFLGFRVFPTHRLLRKENVVHRRRCLSRLARRYAAGAVSVDGVSRSVRAWLAHAAWADSWGLRRHVVERTLFTTPTELRAS